MYLFFLIPAEKRTFPNFCAILPESGAIGEYSLAESKAESILKISNENSGRIQITEQGEPIIVYNYDMQLKEGVPDRYRRSGYIHPVFDLKGQELTDDFPADHYHHRGLSWMWPKVFVNGKRYDLWHIYGPQGQYEGIHQKFDKWLFKEEGPVCATFGVKNSWVLDDQHKVMDEWVCVRVFRTGKRGRAIDISLTWQALEPIEIEGQDKKGYGGLNFRLAPRRETIITTSEGLETSDSDLKEVAWADQSAKFADSEDFSGVAIFQNQQNPDFPAGWCLRHYGFLGVAWPGVVPVKFEPGKPLTLRFRIWVHDGDVEKGNVKEAFHVFKNPPVIQ